MNMRVGMRAAAVIAAILMPVAALAQQNPALPSSANPQPMSQGLPMDDHDHHPDPTAARMQVQRLAALEADRQKKLVADTNKLLLLANELKVEVDRSTKNTLSLEVIRKADEIERLAHSVKERMKD